MLTYSLDFRFQVSHVLAFDAPRLQTINIAEALMRVTKSVVIHGSELPQALEDVLRESPRLGMHTGVVHLSLGSQQDANVLNVGKYVWAHHDYQPWGMALPMQCPQCGTIQKWTSIYLQNNGYRYECGYSRCGYDDEARQAWPYVTIRLIVLRFLLISLSNRGAHLIVSVYLI